jgi:capsule biosynthesis phosphatase
MKFILTCGGVGKRLNNYSLPKPLNYVNGKYMIEHVIENIPSEEIYIIYNIYLKEYNFEEIVVNLFKTKKFFFSVVDYVTRGAVETSYIGVNSFNIDCNESIVFLDNDNIYNFTNFPTSLNENFISYSICCDNKKNYSFIVIKNNKIVNIAEKVKISDNFCCGMYGFKNIETFNTYAKKILFENLKTKNEFYFSKLYELMIQNMETIIPVYIEKTQHLGYYNELNNFNFKNKLRICFDIDNTLVTYPVTPNDYSSVKPINKMINLVKFLKEQGHYIILHTARRMKTHDNNVGKVIKDVAIVTIDTLNKFCIPYDELIFGKPLADIYVDDRSINPYINNISYFGIFNNESDEFIHNKIKNNKYNYIKKCDDKIIKRGLKKFLEGEIFFYKNIPEHISYYFPKFHNCTIINQDVCEYNIDYVDGIPLFFLHKNNLITEKIIDNLFEILNNIHNTNNEIIISKKNIHNNYIKKLKDRFNEQDYFFNDANDIFIKIISDLDESFSPKIVGIIHGDFWFSNILLEYSENYKFIDMKGQLDNIFTLNGDMYYDYGKLYQSILGYDLYLNNCNINEEYLSNLKFYFLKKCETMNINIKYLTAVTHSLIFGVFHSIEDSETKQNIWNFLKHLIKSE